MSDITYYYVASQDSGGNPIFAIESTTETSISKSSRFIDGRKHHACYRISSPQSLAQLLHKHNEELAGKTQYLRELPEGLTPVALAKGEGKFPRPLSFRELEDLGFHASRLYPDLYQKLFSEE